MTDQERLSEQIEARKIAERAMLLPPNLEHSKLARAYLSLARQLTEVEDKLQEIDKITDVMIGNGPGAIEAYHTRGKGLPTMYSHLVDHAKEIRKLIHENSE